MSEELARAREIRGYALGALDGRIGECHDILFDDTSWVIRYIVADTRKWLPGRKVLISPISIGGVDKSTGTLQVNLTREQIKNSPPLDADAPVSRQYEILFNRYYTWSHYWEGDLAWGVHPYPQLLRPADNGLPGLGGPQEIGELPEAKTHLESADEVIGYQVLATDTDVGHIEDFIIEAEPWIIRYLVIDTSNWLPGSKWVMVPTSLAKMVDWARSAIVVQVAGDRLKDSPEYLPTRRLDRDYEQKIFDFYTLPYYW